MSLKKNPTIAAAFYLLYPDCFKFHYNSNCIFQLENELWLCPTVTFFIVLWQILNSNLKCGKTFRLSFLNIFAIHSNFALQSEAISNSFQELLIWISIKKLQIIFKYIIDTWWFTIEPFISINLIFNRFRMTNECFYFSTRCNFYVLSYPTVINNNINDY